jgi:hypothetical protein
VDQAAAAGGTSQPARWAACLDALDRGHGWTVAAWPTTVVVEELRL